MNAQERREWLGWRQKGVTGTDVACIMGLSPYGDIASVWDDKKNSIPDDTDKPVFERGRILEPIVLKKWTDETGGSFTPGYPVTHKDKEYRRGTPDAFTQSKGIVEIGEVKCFSVHLYNTIKRADNRHDALPIYTHTQGQWYSHISGIKKIRYIIFSPELWEFIEIESEADPDLQRMMIEAADNFWFKVLPGERPFSYDYPNVEGLRDDTVVQEIDGALWKAAMIDYQVAKMNNKTAQAALDKTKSVIAELMGDHVKARNDKWSISYKPTASGSRSLRITERETF